MTYILGSNSRKKLEGVHPKLVQVVQLAIQKTTQDFSVYEGLRTKNRQVKLVQRGASQTMNSKHLPQNDGYGHVPQVMTDIGFTEDIFQSAQLPEYQATVLIHKSGIRVGISNDLLKEV